MQYFKNMKTLNKKKTFDQVTGIQMERSPTRWKTMYRDQYRKFSGSPQRGEVALDGYPEEGGEQFNVEQVMDDQQIGSYPTS